MFIALFLIMATLSVQAAPTIPVTLDPSLTSLLCDINLTPLGNSEASAQTLMARFQQPDVAAHFAALGLGTNMGVITHVTDERGRVLMGQRQGSFRPGTWSSTGGHIDPTDASPFATAIREAREEMGVELGQPLFLGATLDILPERNQAYVTFHIGSTIAFGTPRSMEPEKLRGTWQWYRPEELPRPLFGPLAHFRGLGGKVGGRHYTTTDMDVGLMPPLTSALRGWRQESLLLGSQNGDVIRRQMNTRHEALAAITAAMGDADLFSEATLIIERIHAAPRGGHMPGLDRNTPMSLSRLIIDHRHFLRGEGSPWRSNRAPRSLLQTSINKLNLSAALLESIQKYEDMDADMIREVWQEYIATAVPHAVLLELARRTGP